MATAACSAPPRRPGPPPPPPRRPPAGPRGGPRPAGDLVFLLASATVSEPGTCARLLTGADAEEITESAAPRGSLTFGLWEPPLTAARGEAGGAIRRSAPMEAAR